jgi:hypothetical protein
MSLEHLFDAELQYRPGMPPITSDGEGRLIGSGDGVARGEKLGGFSTGRCSSSPASSSAR